VATGRSDDGHDQSISKVWCTGGRDHRNGGVVYGNLERRTKIAFFSRTLAQKKKGDSCGGI
jgi:hypothetical protein